MNSDDRNSLGSETETALCRQNSDRNEGGLRTPDSRGPLALSLGGHILVVLVSRCVAFRFKPRAGCTSLRIVCLLASLYWPKHPATLSRRGNFPKYPRSDNCTSHYYFTNSGQNLDDSYLRNDSLKDTRAVTTFTLHVIWSQPSQTLPGSGIPLSPKS